VAVAVEQTLGGDQKPVVEAPGLFELLMQFRLKELRRSMSLINRFLDVLGKEIKQNAEASKSK
jgi:hypothetical protein